jgi:hypothetical protein
VIALPVAISLADLAATVEGSVPKVLVDQRGEEVREGVLVDVHAERTGPLRAMGHHGKLAFEVPVEVSAIAYTAIGAERRAARGKEPIGPRVEAELVVEITLDLGLADDWSLESDTTISHRWTEKPKVSLGPLRFGIEKLADRQLTPIWPEVAAEVDGRVREENRVQVRIQESWNTLAEPALVHGEPPTWWIGEPEAMYVGKLWVDSEAIRLTIGIVGRFGLLVGSPGVAAPPSPLPPRGEPPADTGFHLALPVTLTWRELSALANAEVAGQTWSLPGKGARAGTLSVEAIELYPSGDRIAVAVAYTAQSPIRDTDGTLYLTGRPVLDHDTRTVVVMDIDYAIETWDRAVSSVAALAASGVKETLQERLVFPFGDRLDAAREQADAGLSEVWTGPGTLVDGELEVLEIREIRLTDVGVVIDTHVSGELSMKVSGTSIWASRR